MKENMKLLVGIDGSDHSKKALQEAIKIARRFSGFIKVITVYKRDMLEVAEQTLHEAGEALKKRQIHHELVPILGSNPSRALVNIAEHEDCDLIVVGSRGLSSTASLLLGSVSKQIATKANCDVLIVKE